MNQEDLLTHAGFIKSLARSLVGDEHYAADVEQKVWIAALEHPPATDTPLRSWFSRVVRNLTVSLYRRETRRRKYERNLAAVSSADTLGITTPEEIAIHKEAIRSLSGAVLSLKEPYLSVIVLRFYEGLPARRIAEQIGVSHETVKTRIGRGLNRLREILDEKHGGDRTKWMLVLAPIAGLKLAPASAGAALSVGTANLAPVKTAAGLSAWNSLTMPAGLKIGLAAALLIGTTAGLFYFLPGSGDDGESFRFSTAGDNRPGGDEKERRGAGAHAARAAREPLFSSKAFVSGRVTDRETGAPVRAFDFRMWRQEESSDPRLVLHETVRDAEGRFCYPLEKDGLYNLAFSSSCYRLKALKDLEGADDSRLSDLNIVLDPGLSVSGRVVEGAANTPVAGAVVGPAMYPWETDLASLSFLGFDEVCVHDRTGPDGRFTIKGLAGTDKRIVAVHPDFTEGWVDAEPGSGREVEIRLQPGGFRLYGKALDDRGIPAARLLIRLYGEEIPAALPVMTGEDGGFTTPPVRPGRVFVKAGDPHMEFENNPDFTEEFKIVTVANRDVEVDFGPSHEHLAWRGRLYGFDGKPIKKGWVMITPANLNTGDARFFNLVRRVHCDDSGSFEAGKLLPGRYRVSLLLSGQPLFEWDVVAFEETGLVEKDIDLGLDSVIAGAVVSSSTGMPIEGEKGYVWAWQDKGTGRKYSGIVDDMGCFEICGIKPVTYFVQAKVGDRFSERIVGVKTEKGSAAGDLSLEIATLGGLQLRVAGFDAGDRESFSLSLLDTALGERTAFGDQIIKKTGTLDLTFSLEAGAWVVSLAFQNLGYVERRFEVLPDRTTEVLVLRDEISLYEGFVSLAGTLARRDGSPLSGLALHFEARSVPGFPPNAGALRTGTDDHGKFLIEGFKPGRWGVAVETAPGARVCFPRLWIPPDSENPFRLDLVLPAGRVSGVVSAEPGGYHLIEDRPRSWTARLLDVKKEEYVSTLAGVGGLFELEGVPAGDYQLLIEAEGYERYRSGAFSVKEGEDLDLGEILLDPCGLVDLEVVDGAMQPVEEYSTACDGRKIEPSRSFGETKRFDKLPVGEVFLTVTAEGYQEQTVKIRTRPAQPVEKRIVLVPE